MECVMCVSIPQMDGGEGRGLTGMTLGAPLLALLVPPVRTVTLHHHEVACKILMPSVTGAVPQA